jgi:hypothetical protein
MSISVVKSVRWLARLSGTLALALGSAYWLGIAVPLHAHMVFGGLLVLSLFTLAFGGRTRAVSLSLMALTLGLVIPAAGMLQLHLPWVDYQWGARLVHVVLGLSGIAIAEMLAGAVAANPVTDLT